MDAPSQLSVSRRIIPPQLKIPLPLGGIHMRKKALGLASLGVLLMASVCQASGPEDQDLIAKPQAQQNSLIPRSVLFGNPDHRAVQISHDGKQISFLAPLDGVMNIW